jgi:hypothetical protein
MAASGFGMFMIITRSTKSIIIFGGLLILLGLVFRVVGVVKLRELLVNIRRKYNITNLIREEMKGFEKARLYFVSANSFEQWWQSVCIAAESMNFTYVTMPVICRDGRKKFLSWTHQNGSTKLTVDGNKEQNQIIMTIPVADRRTNSPLRLKVNINTNGSLESAARRARLFNRLMDEYSLVKLARNEGEQVISHQS